ncbi:MAG: helix-turn-helix domain-containing protein [Actinomycetota bacterium]|nr:helix-turn-helix domain-containing protein [Actinomycetota bacterium]
MCRTNKFYTIEEATDILGVSEHEIMNMITLGELPAVKIEKTIRIREEDIEKFLDNLGGKNYVAPDSTDCSTRLIEEPVGEIKREEIKDKYRVYESENVSDESIVQLGRSYKELLRKKTELEEDINYLQYKYDEFRDRIKRIISDEFKLFLKKIDEESLQEGDDILEDNFDDGMEIGGNISDSGEDKESNKYEFNNKETLPGENNEED